MSRTGAFAPAGRAPAGAARQGAGGAAGRMPVAGAVVGGAAVGLGLTVGASVVLGTLQRLGAVVFVPGWMHALAAYVSVVAGGWTAGRLAGRAGMASGALVGALLLGVAAWLAGRPAQVLPEVLLAPDWAAAWWRMALAVVAAALAGGLAVSGA